MEDNPMLQLKNQPSVIAHIEMMQGIINRLAEISARCKEWCFTFIGALLVILLSVDSTPNPRFIIIPYVIVVLFYILDSYYLGLERSMRSNYQDFLDSIEEVSEVASGEQMVKVQIDNIINSIYYPHLISDKPSQGERFKRQLKVTAKAMPSLSTIIPYGILVILVVICNFILV